MPEGELSRGKALFRLPAETAYHRIEGTATAGGDGASLPAGGFFIVPFDETADVPAVRIEEERHEVLPIDFEANAPLPAAALDAEFEAVQRASYHAAFSAAHARLADGELQKAVLSRRKRLRLEADIIPEQLFLRACAENPDCYVALWHTPQTGCWLTATPELLLGRDEADGSWHTMALAGTMGRSVPNAPVSLHDWSGKNRAEQAVVSDYISQRLRLFATDISQGEARTFGVGNICHLRTDFSFALPDASPDGVLRALHALHPTPAVCGHPTDLARRLILSLETTPRRYYSGFSGYASDHASAAFYVSLRCMNLRAEEAVLYAGGGLMADSAEEDEWSETERKMQPMLRLFNLS